MFVRNSLATKRDYVSFYSFLKNRKVYDLLSRLYIVRLLFSLCSRLRTKINRTVIINNKNRSHPKQICERYYLRNDEDKLKYLRREEENCLMDVMGRHIRQVRLPISQR